jgi:zeta-carotene desaturase
VSRWIPSLRFDFQDVPILGVHLWFDRPVMTESHAALFQGPLQWIFRKDSTGTSLHGVISAARDWVDRSKDEMLQLFEQQVRRVLPDARDAKLNRGVIVIEKRATFAPLPGVDSLRPSQKPLPRMPNLYLAGDYTQTGWPATMEGAVRSGYLAAQSILPGSRFVVDDLPVQWPGRLLGLHR